MKKLDHKLFKAAAEEIDKGEFIGACVAIADQRYSPGKALRESIAFRELYKPEDSTSIYWMETEREHKKNKAHRVIALLFAAEMAKTGDLK